MIKHRATVDCPIAGTLVTVQPRSGTYLGESGRPYVRCSDRDCQYVDLNEPPCPLRPDMFDDARDSRLLAHLAHTPGQRFCFACLMSQLETTHDAIRRMAYRLSVDNGALIRPGRCAACRRRCVCIQLADASHQSSPELAADLASAPLRDDRRVEGTAPGAGVGVLAVIQRLRTSTSCAGCLALASGLPLDAARQALDALTSARTVSVDRGRCGTCGREQPVFRAVAPAAFVRPARVNAGSASECLSGAVAQEPPAVVESSAGTTQGGDRVRSLDTNASIVTDLILAHALCVDCIASKAGISPQHVEVRLAELRRHFRVSDDAACDGCQKSIGAHRFGSDRPL